MEVKKKTWEMEEPHAQVLRPPSFHPFFFFFFHLENWKAQLKRVGNPRYIISQV